MMRATGLANQERTDAMHIETQLQPCMWWCRAVVGAYEAYELGDGDPSSNESGTLRGNNRAVNNGTVGN